MLFVSTMFLSKRRKQFNKEWQTFENAEKIPSFLESLRKAREARKKDPKSKGLRMQNTLHVLKPVTWAQRKKVRALKQKLNRMTLDRMQKVFQNVTEQTSDIIKHKNKGELQQAFQKLNQARTTLDKYIQMMPLRHMKGMKRQFKKMSSVFNKLETNLHFPRGQTSLPRLTVRPTQPPRSNVKPPQLARSNVKAPPPPPSKATPTPPSNVRPPQRARSKAKPTPPSRSNPNPPKTQLQTIEEEADHFFKLTKGVLSENNKRAWEEHFWRRAAVQMLSNNLQPFLSRSKPNPLENLKKKASAQSNNVSCGFHAVNNLFTALWGFRVFGTCDDMLNYVVSRMYQNNKGVPKNILKQHLRGRDGQFTFQSIHNIVKYLSIGVYDVKLLEKKNHRYNRMTLNSMVNHTTFNNADADGRLAGGIIVKRGHYTCFVKLADGRFYEIDSIPIYVPKNGKMIGEPSITLLSDLNRLRDRNDFIGAILLRKKS